MKKHFSLLILVIISTGAWAYFQTSSKRPNLYTYQNWTTHVESMIQTTTNSTIQIFYLKVKNGHQQTVSAYVLFTPLPFDAETNTVDFSIFDPVSKIYLDETGKIRSAWDIHVNLDGSLTEKRLDK